jgi:hypothetical protein
MYRTNKFVKTLPGYFIQVQMKFMFRRCHWQLREQHIRSMYREPVRLTVASLTLFLTRCCTCRGLACDRQRFVPFV